MQTEEIPGFTESLSSNRKVGSEATFFSHQIKSTNQTQSPPPSVTMSPQTFSPSAAQSEVDSDIPTNANEHCVGTESALAYPLNSLELLIKRGLADSC